MWDESLWEPHPACARCFTVPGGPTPYQIYEEVETDGPEETWILSRLLPNPAPLGDGEVRDTYDAAGEEIWYIGTQGYVGPTDEERWADAAPRPTIDLIRLRERHQSFILGFPGVCSFGLGGRGFLVSMAYDAPGVVAHIPHTLEGVPVEVESGPFCEDDRYRENRGTFSRACVTTRSAGTDATKSPRAKRTARAARNSRAATDTSAPAPSRVTLSDAFRGACTDGQYTPSLSR